MVPDGEINPICLSEVERVVEAAVQRASVETVRDLKAILLALGINADDPNYVLESQKDMAWTRRVRQASETAPGKIGLAVFGALLAAIGGIFTIFAKHWFDGFWAK